METMIAMVVIFGSLTALAYTATVGFRYISYGRDRQQATAYANKIMEEIRGQAYSVITRGMSTSDLTGDAKIVSCTSPTATRFESCSGPKIVSTTVSGGTTAPWIIPHKSSTAVTVGHLKLNWATYVTNDNTASNPYTVTVIVTWGNGAIANGPNNTVRLQSQFWSPSGCVSSSTHPFAAPCQPFYYGLAQVPEGSISFNGQLHDSFVDWEKGALTFPEARALSQQEQIISTTADATESRIEMQDSAGLEEGGGTTAQSVADTDPGSSTTSSAGASLAGIGDAVERLQTDTPGQIGLQLTIPAGQLGNANVSTAAKSTDTYACPPSGTRENDSLPVLERAGQAGQHHDGGRALQPRGRPGNGERRPRDRTVRVLDRDRRARRGLRLRRTDGCPGDEDLVGCLPGWVPDVGDDGADGHVGDRHQRVQLLHVPHGLRGHRAGVRRVRGPRRGRPPA